MRAPSGRPEPIKAKYALATTQDWHRDVRADRCLDAGRRRRSREPRGRDQFERPTARTAGCRATQTATCVRSKAGCVVGVRGHRAVTRRVQTVARPEMCGPGYEHQIFHNVGERKAAAGLNVVMAFVEWLDCLIGAEIDRIDVVAGTAKRPAGRGNRRCAPPGQRRRMRRRHGIFVRDRRRLIAILGGLLPNAKAIPSNCRVSLRRAADECCVTSDALTHDRV